jgi:tRNA(fMet)-specific endonuclease VapC
MIRYLLDTDLLSLFTQGHPAVCRAVAAHPSDELAITVISVEEQLTGWYTLLRRANSAKQEAAIYLRLTRSVRFLANIQIVTYSEPAIDRYHRLTALKLNVGGKDLRIAAIALEEGCTVVTRNLRGFGRIPGLVVEDWAT